MKTYRMASIPWLVAFLFAISLAKVGGEQQTSPSVDLESAGATRQEVIYSPNLLLICDSASLIENIEFLGGNGYGYQFRVAGCVSASMFGEAMGFAYAIVPDYAPRIRASEKRNIVAYYLDEITLDKKVDNPAHDALLEALYTMADRTKIESELVETSQEAENALMIEPAVDQKNRLTTPSPPDEGQQALRNLLDSSVQRDRCGYDYDDMHDPQKNFTRHFHNGVTVVYVIADGGDPKLDWSQEMLSYTEGQAIIGLNHLAELCEEYAFPVTFYVKFEYVQIPYEPIMGYSHGDWLT